MEEVKGDAGPSMVTSSLGTVLFLECRTQSPRSGKDYLSCSKYGSVISVSLLCYSLLNRRAHYCCNLGHCGFSTIRNVRILVTSQALMVSCICICFLCGNSMKPLGAEDFLPR